MYLKDCSHFINVGKLILLTLLFRIYAVDILNCTPTEVSFSFHFSRFIKHAMNTKNSNTDVLSVSFLCTGTFNALSTGLPKVFMRSVHAGCTVGANACLHTSTFLRLFLSHSAKLGRGWAVNLLSYTLVLPNTHQTGLILLFSSQSCCIVVNKQHFSGLGDSHVLKLVVNVV